MIETDDLIVLLLGAPGPPGQESGRIEGITRLEKLAFLIEKERAPEWLTEDADFVSHNFGPFSSKIYTAVDTLVAGLGLRGASHGIGYGEYRIWRELPQSGPPPARYYLRRAHRFVSQELAYQLYLRDRSLVECPCAECNGQAPISLDYHALMRHSVRVRAEEIQRWSQLDPGEAADLLETECEAFAREVRRTRLPPFLIPQADRSYHHLPRWVEALRLL